MDLINKTASAMNYAGKAYGPGKVIPMSDAHAAKPGVVAMIEAGQLEPALGKVAASEGLTVEQLKVELTAKGIEFEAGAKKAELAALLDAASVA